MTFLLTVENSRSTEAKNTGTHTHTHTGCRASCMLVKYSITELDSHYWIKFYFFQIIKLITINWSLINLSSSLFLCKDSYWPLPRQCLSWDKKQQARPAWISEACATVCSFSWVLGTHTQVLGLMTSVFTCWANSPHYQLCRRTLSNVHFADICYKYDQTLIVVKVLRTDIRVYWSILEQPQGSSLCWDTARSVMPLSRQGCVVCARKS